MKFVNIAFLVLGVVISCLFIATAAPAQQVAPGRMVVEFTEEAKAALNLVKLNNVQLTSIDPIDQINHMAGIKNIRPLYRGPSQRLKNVYIFKFSENIEVRELIARYKGLKEFKWVEPDYLVPVGGAADPNDPLAVDDIGLHQAKYLEAYHGEYGSESVVLQINDTGCGWQHPDLGGNLW